MIATLSLAGYMCITTGQRKKIPTNYQGKFILMQLTSKGTLFSFSGLSPAAHARIFCTHCSLVFAAGWAHHHHHHHIQNDGDFQLNHIQLK